MNPYYRARDLCNAEDFDGAWKIIYPLLQDNPNDVHALVTAGFLLRRAGRLVESYHLSKAATRMMPHDAAPWINLGHAASEMWLVDEAEQCYKRAMQCKNIGTGTLLRNTLLNTIALYSDNARYREALPLIDRLLKLDPADRAGLSNLGFCELAMRKWDTGWKNYHNTLGSEWRPQTQFKDEPEWDGTPGKTVILYGEQGLGDEISFASMVPDAIESCKKVIIECDPRLKGLFTRSFPKATVYGTRKTKEGAQWAKEDWNFDASLAIGQIGEFYRTNEAAFPGTPYLKPCPIRTEAWKAVFSGVGKPIIGIAWRGGIAKTNARNRQLTLKELLPIFRSVDAHWVSLQYKDASAEIDAFKAQHPEVDLVQYPWATITSDYDDTAALVAAMDHVVCMQTAVAHTAGALGVPVTVLVPHASQWRYGLSEDTIPWYNCLRVIRQEKHGNWKREIAECARRIGAAYGEHPPSGGDDIERSQSNGHYAPVGLRVRGSGEAGQAPEGRS